jgi:small subunit ribosomal protein S20
LANIKSAIKRIRSSERRRKINQLHRSRARTLIKKTHKLIDAGEFEEAQVAAQEATSALDKAAQKGIIHKNRAARSKSRLMKGLNRAKQHTA